MENQTRKSDQVLGIADIMKGVISIMYRLPQIVTSFLEILKLDEKKVKSHLQNAKRNIKICLEKNDE